MSRVGSVWMMLMLGCCWPGLLRAAPEQTQAILTNKTGIVKYKPRDKVEEFDAPYQLPLFANDLIRTRENSTAVVWVRNHNCSIRLREMSTLQILPQEQDSGPLLSLLQGALYLFSRERAPEVRIRTPHATGAPRGTEFVIFVESDRTFLAMYDGTATLTNDLGRVDLQRGEMGIAQAGKGPTKRSIEATNIVQWWLYYPGVLDLKELEFTPSERISLAASLDAYQSGDLPRALSVYPGYPSPSDTTTDSGRIYLAGLLLSVGEVGRAEVLLDRVKTVSSLAAALRWVIAAVQQKLDKPSEVGVSASEWLGRSYYLQADHDLEKALDAAKHSVAISTNFAFAWERVAELQFSFGRIQEAKSALDQSLRLAPRNAQAQSLRGFLLSAENRWSEARAAFDAAIQLDSSLGNAWLGRGLVRIRKGNPSDGRADLEMAAVLEPNRSLLHSYLGKAFSDGAETENAALEFKRAQYLDSKDPTSWLYSALLKRGLNQVNGAVNDLEKSIQLNKNRAVYRSQLMLDEDRAVRGANLAGIYRDAGMTDVSLREAARAVTYDYANASAHLFLADSYYALRDPAQFNLRYETVWFNELLLANVLSPVGGGRLAQGLSQQEYSKLFESDGLHLASSTEARSDGVFHQLASQYGTFGNTAYALDLDYHHNNGVRPNNGLDDIEWNTTIKQQITSQDTAMLLVQYQDYHSGDNFQYSDSANARPFFKFDEYQQPILVGAWHHEWSPGMHTILLLGRLTDEQFFSDRAAPQRIFFEDTTHAVGFVGGIPFDVNYHNQFTIYSAELNQICEWERVTLSAGVRYQTGTFHTDDQFSNPGLFSGLFANPATADSVTAGFDRKAAYAYLTIRPVQRIWLTGGLAADEVIFPENYRHPPVALGETRRSQVGPKAALVWNPLSNATLRGIYTRSLGGVSLDESYRLEPTQLAGFPQAFRSLISESVKGSLSAPAFETLGAAMDFKLANHTYAGVQVERLRSGVDQNLGVLVSNGVQPASSASTGERLEYTEHTLSVSLNQFIGNEVVLGAAYKVIQSDLHDVLPDVPLSVLATADSIQKALLHEADGYLLFNHPSGFFARAETHWYRQGNSAELGDDFFQHNIFVGYRFAHRHAELELGLLNLTSRDYHLNPLTVYQELPRSRVFEARFNFVF